MRTITRSEERISAPRRSGTREGGHVLRNVIVAGIATLAVAGLVGYFGTEFAFGHIYDLVGGPNRIDPSAIIPNNR